MKENQLDVISAEDKALIRTMVALPLENKFLAKGIILGLSLAHCNGAITAQARAEPGSG